MIHESDSRLTSSVTFRVQDFVGEDGVEYSDIEILVELDGDIREAAKVAESLRRPDESERCRSPMKEQQSWHSKCQAI
jgi:hypothetical protein